MRKRGFYLAIGDSTTHKTPNSPNLYSAYPNQLSAWIRQNYSPVQMLNKGVGGWTSTQCVNSFNYVGTFGGDVDLLTMGFGINDKTGYPSPAVTVTQFKSNIQSIVDRFRAANPSILIILCASNTLTIVADNDATQAYRNAMDEVAALYPSGVYVAHFENAWTPAQGGTYTSDGIHPNTAGFNLITNNILIPVMQTNASAWLKSLIS